MVSRRRNAEKAAGRGDGRGRASGGGASGAGRVGAGGAAGHSGRHRCRVQRGNRRAGVSRRRLATAVLRRTCSRSGTCRSTWTTSGTRCCAFRARLVEEANAFDALMSDVAGAIERGGDRDPTLALGRPRHQRRGGTGHAARDHRRDAAAARGGERPHLGVLQPEPGAAGGIGAPQGGRGDRQSALA